MPTLALPDGSHNFDDDTVFFHLPGLKNSKETVFGISCFRQIPVEVYTYCLISNFILNTLQFFRNLKIKLQILQGERCKNRFVF